MRERRAKILAIDDDPSVLSVLRHELGERGYEVCVCPTGKQALERLTPAPDLILLDRNLPDFDGLELLERFARIEPMPPVVMLTGHTEIRAVVEAMRAGAWDYLAKPYRIESIIEVVERALAQHRASRADGDPATDGIIGDSPALRRAKTLIRRIARSPASTVLITGESGTGKDLAARAIHAHSTRSRGPFVNVTCSALPANLLESELFGHERGAFTDAKHTKIGLVEQAEGGTLFLDEMGELELGMQAKLLRFLEDKAFRRVGGTTELRADVRVIAATNVDLPRAVLDRRFREDLYYRLAVLTVELPPLRERPGDVSLLARHFLAHFAEQFDQPKLELGSRATQLLENHAWPGNIRELKNTIERAVLLAEHTVLSGADFELTPAAPASPREVELPTQGVDLPADGVDLRELERTLVRQALSRCKGNITRAAKLLGLNRDQIRYRVNKFGLQDELGAHRAAAL
jgi:two-component system response regulator AtoC